MKGKVNDLYTKFNNIYNELNSTSTSYMKGKINSIYNNIGSGGMGIKSVQYGMVGTVSESTSGRQTKIAHNQVNINKSFVILNIAGKNGYVASTVMLYSRTSTEITVLYRFTYSDHISWQLVEFY